MNKLTKEEIQELKILMTRLEEADFEDAEAEDENEVEIDIRKWVEQKKKEWQEEAYMKGYTDTEDEFNEMFKLKSDRP
jgi:hypothetical protein